MQNCGTIVLLRGTAGQCTNLRDGGKLRVLRRFRALNDRSHEQEPTAAGSIANDPLACVNARAWLSGSVQRVSLIAIARTARSPAAAAGLPALINYS